jgi:acyl-coenzyme A thioesterase PaaI-like protein
MAKTASIPSHRNCFACGSDNECGLGLDISYCGKTAWCNVKLDRRFQGYPGIVHGGILASIADSVMVNLVHHLYGGEPKTCRLDLRLRNSMNINSKIRADAKIQRSKRDFIWVYCKIYDDNKEYATANGIFRL